MPVSTITRRGYLLALTLTPVAANAVSERSSAASETTDETTQNVSLQSDDTDVLVVPSGETHTVGPSETETFARSEIMGTMLIDGSLQLTGEAPEEHETLTVEAEDTHTIDSGQSETYPQVVVDGTLSVNGTLTASG